MLFDSTWASLPKPCPDPLLQGLELEACVRSEEAQVQQVGRHSQHISFHADRSFVMRAASQACAS